jgi:two-component system, LytTR family, response regulator
MGLRVIIIDDEIDAIEAIEKIIETKAKEIEIVAKTDNPHKALQLILMHQPDLVFLDIEMPGMNGFELLSNLPKIDFEIVFVTAYENYAIKAIKENAIDYILKPINIAEVLNAIEKVRLKIKSLQNNSFQYEMLIGQLKKAQLKRIQIPTTNGYEFIHSDNIVRLEASGAYTYAFFIDSSKIIISKSIKEIEPSLKNMDFFRAHRSHIINLLHVKRFLTENDGEIIMVDDSRIPLSRRKRKDFIDIINQTY